ncbi:MAG: XRE family transcriptional regulator [Actinomycetota bacterium]
MTDQLTIDQVVRSRLRTLRTSLGYSLQDLAGRTNLSPSTISRIETGKRAISLDVLVPLARAFHVSVDSLLEGEDDADVVIRPSPTRSHGWTIWALSQPGSRMVAIKARLEPTSEPPTQQVHPGHDWFVVVAGRVRLLLGDREIVVETGEAAEFATMTPHAIEAVDGPAEVVMVFDRDGQRAHVHHGGEPAA